MLKLYLKEITASTILVLGMTAAGAALADEYEDQDERDVAGEVEEMTDEADEMASEAGEVFHEDQAEELADAKDLLREAAETLDLLKADERLGQYLEQAKAVFIAPDFARAALGVGASGGQGVVLTRPEGEWQNPAFYNFGEISVGAQVGVDAGAIAMLLMTDEAVDSFKQENNFAISAEAGLSVINWSEAVEASAGRGDVILWTDTEGLFAGAEVGVSDINSDEDANWGYYGKKVTVAEVLEGRVENPHENIFAQVD
jgi:lipid-binding SYLF domain-containing protein